MGERPGLEGGKWTLRCFFGTTGDCGGGPIRCSPGAGRAPAKGKHPGRESSRPASALDPHVGHSFDEALLREDEHPRRSSLNNPLVLQVELLVLHRRLPNFVQRRLSTLPLRALPLLTSLRTTAPSPLLTRRQRPGRRHRRRPTQPRPHCLIEVTLG